LTDCLKSECDYWILDATCSILPASLTDAEGEGHDTDARYGILN
jgi:hypothetical protein